MSKDFQRGVRGEPGPNDRDVEINAGGDVNIRLINGFRLSRDAMLAFMQNSDPLIGLTGDQSFVEGLCSSKLVAYQAMTWKIKEIQELSRYCKEKFGAESPLSKFYELQLVIGDDVTEQQRVAAWDKLITLTVEERELLDEQAKQLRDLIRRERNLSNNLPETVRQLAMDCRIRKVMGVQSLKYGLQEELDTIKLTFSTSST